jgi:hypothetical protein
MVRVVLERLVALDELSCAAPSLISAACARSEAIALEVGRGAR